jgi:simple sugar transport system permease protein
VVFAAWRPGWALVGAYIFGAASVLQLHAQAAGFGLPGQALSAVPYVATILALVVLLDPPRPHRRGAPGSLGQPFVPDR